MQCHHKKPSRQGAEEQKKLQTRLRRIEGQVRGIQRMIEEEAYCDDILHQITATRAGLREVQCLLLESHIQYCISEQMQQGSEEAVPELIATVRKMLK